MIAACEGAKPESRETTINYVTSSTNGKLRKMLIYIIKCLQKGL